MKATANASGDASTGSSSAAGSSGANGGRSKAKKAKAPQAKSKSDAAQGRGIGKVVTVGSVMADTIAVAEPGLIERAEFKRAGVTAMLIEEGRKYTAQSIRVHLGGGGANSAVAAARLGWSAAALAAVGADANGDMLLEKLKAEGVDVSAIRRDPDTGTGVSLIVTSDQANASILIFRGASETLRVEDIRDPVFEGARLVYIGPLSSGSADCFPALVEQGAWAGAMVAVNPGVRQLRSRGETFVGAVANVDLVSVNARELSWLTLAMFARGAFAETETAAAPLADRESGARLPRESFGDGAQRVAFRDALSALHGFGPRFISVTDGAHGSYLSIAEEDGATRLFYQAPAPADQVKGTAGAGDSYGATLACSLAQGLAPEDAMRRAALNAASVVGEINTTDGLMTQEAMESAIASADFPAALDISTEG